MELHPHPLEIARNQTTRFQYLWCRVCKLVFKDYDFDGEHG